MPYRPDQVDVAGIFAFVPGCEHQLSRPPVAEPVTLAGEHVQDGALLAVRAFGVVVAVVVVVPRGQQPQIPPAAFAGEIADPGRVRLRDHDEAELTGEVRGSTVERVQDRGTRWARCLGERQPGRLAVSGTRPGVA